MKIQIIEKKIANRPRVHNPEHVYPYTYHTRPLLTLANDEYKNNMPELERKIINMMKRRGMRGKFVVLKSSAGPGRGVKMKGMGPKKLFEINL